MRIRYYCHAGQETGYGIAATELALALLEAGVELEVIPLNPALSRFDVGAAQALAPHVGPVVRDGDIDPDAIIVHTLPLDCPRARPRLDRGDIPVIAYTTWEGLSAPSEVEHPLLSEGYFHDVWVPSQATAGAIGGDVFVLPHTYTPRTYERVERGDGRFRFYYVGAWSARKSVPGLIRAFAHAFGPQDPVELLIHSNVSVESFAAALATTGLEQSALPRIRLSNEHVSADAIARLHASADCFVTATRGESWNLPAFEAMLAGRNIIAPMGMGHDDFLWGEAGEGDTESLTSAIGVPGEPQPAIADVVGAAAASGAFVFNSKGAQGLTSKSTWIDPSLAYLGNRMFDVLNDHCTHRPNCHPSTLTVHYDIAARFGHAAVAKMAIDRINHLKETRF